MNPCWFYNGINQLIKLTNYVIQFDYWLITTDLTSYQIEQ